MARLPASLPVRCPQCDAEAGLPCIGRPPGSPHDARLQFDFVMALWAVNVAHRFISRALH